MKNIYLILFLSISVNTLFGQISDSFSDGNLNFQPVWVGDTSCYIVNSSKRLQLNAPSIAGDMYISTASAVAYNAVWSLKVKFNFNPSTSNYCKIYLNSGEADLKASLCGFYVRIGYTDDNICLYKIKGTKDSLMIKGPTKMLDVPVVDIAIKVTRDNAGNWELLSDNTGGTNWTSLGSGTDHTLTKYVAFGIRCFYTQTRSTKFEFDDINVSGTIFKDSIPPKIIKYEIKSDSAVQLTFSEPIDKTTVINDDFYLEDNPVLSIISDTLTNLSATIHFNNPFIHNFQIPVLVKNIQDTWGNFIKDTTVLLNNGETDFVENVIINSNYQEQSDFMKIICNIQENGCRLTINLYNVMGRLTKQLYNDRAAPGNSTFSWNGLNESGSLCSTGVYILYLRAVYDNGVIKEFKKACIISNRH